MSPRILPFGAAGGKKRVGTVHRDGSVTFEGATYRTLADVPESCQALRIDVETEAQWRALYRAVIDARAAQSAAPKPRQRARRARPGRGPAGAPRLNAEWHAANRMPDPATIEQRLVWHREHARHCGCRKMPPKIEAELRARGWIE